jgi:eukaryotic-like serine/threonine-protein kinase
MNAPAIDRSLPPSKEDPAARLRLQRTEHAVTSDGSRGSWLIAGRYRVTALLGRGGMADVFRARDELLHRDVAVKVFATGQEVQRRADREMRTLASLRHVNLITVLDAGVDTTDSARAVPYLVMELINGPTLAQQIANGPLDPAEVADLGVQIATALSYVHDRDIVHRDIKPANILLAPDPSETGRWTAKLTDFGIARALHTAPLTMTGMTIGTANYVSPEQALGQAIRPSSDIYSLGLVLLEALTGQRAVAGSALSVALARIDHPPRVPAQLGPDWVRLLTAMTAQDPAARPCATDVTAALQDIRAGQTSPIVVGPLDMLLGGGLAHDVERAAASPANPEPLITIEKSGFRRTRWIVLTALAATVLAISIVAMGAISRPHRAPTAPARPAESTARPQVPIRLSTASPAGRANTTSQGPAAPTVPAAPQLPPKTAPSNKSAQPRASTVTSTSGKSTSAPAASPRASSSTSADGTAPSQTASASPTQSASTPPPPTPTPNASPTASPDNTPPSPPSARG